MYLNRSGNVILTKPTQFSNALHPIRTTLFRQSFPESQVPSYSLYNR